MLKQKIKSIKLVGKMPVYDIEVPDTRNFVLDNGVVAHNCAYAELGYITMYLKRNFFLEWWAAELNNSGEDKIRHYISILGDKITPPSIKNPSDTFAISDGKISAPLSTIKGLGPASIKSIIKRGPYRSIEEFVEKTKGKVNASHFWAILKAGVFDEFAESDMTVSEIRRFFLDYYSNLRKMKSVPADVANLSPIDMFLSQRDVYKCFNKTILSDNLIRKQITEIWPTMRETNKKDIPLAFGFSPSVPVIASVNVADKILKNQEFNDNQNVVKVAMVGLFQSSEHKSGVSKTGKPWSLVRVNISDGLTNIECVKWDQNKSFRFPKNSLVYVMGVLKNGWKGAPSLEILDIEKIESLKVNKNKKTS
jgi:DNA polymerase III alpha subunit